MLIFPRRFGGGGRPKRTSLFAYNADGLRTRKTVNGVEHIYTLEGSRIVTEAWGDNLLIYLYDESGAPIGMQYRNTTYAANRFDTFYFEKNLQGDVVAVYNSSGIKVISYTYDAWGNHTVTWHDSYSTNFNAYYNPFRYRGYYYDTDTGFYYLQSRYYNPQWGRFLNADGYVNANGDMIGFNMYAYCSNNPVMLVDSSGNRAERIVRVNGGVVDQDPRTLRYFLYCLKQDMQAFDIDNASEDAVFAANYLAGYNGTVVVKTSLLGRSAFSFGIIVMGDKITKPDTIKHEYGHHLQFKDMGLVNYSCYVAAPSLLHAGLRELGIVQNYHSLPWEYDANMRSGAQKGPYTVDAEARRQKWKLWMEASLWM